MTDDAAAYALLWGKRKVSTRGPKPAMTIEQIVREAVRVADAEGIGAVTLERVATELGYSKMSLYRYVTGKDELLALMIEASVDVPPDLRAATGWRARVEAFAAALAQVWSAHPWLPWAAVGERAMGPRELAWVECVVGALDDTSLTGRERLDATYLIFGHMRNSQSMSMTGTQPWLPDRQVRPALRKALEGRDRFGALSRTVESIDAQAPSDNGREFGLQVILAGIAALVDNRDAGRR